MRTRDFVAYPVFLTTPLLRLHLLYRQLLVWLQKNALKTILLWVVLFCSLLAGNLRAQLTARIGYDSVSTCPPYKAQFADSSLGEPDSWFWDFGNGQTSSLRNDTVIYKSPGYYTVKLIVHKGLTVDSTFKKVYVLGASAGFHYTYTNVCNAPATFHFLVNNSFNTANYHWTFGDGSVSIEQNPTRTFPAGKFKINLQTISKEGCLDSLTKTVQAGSVKAAFSTPATVCANEITLFNNNSGVEPVSAVWTVNNVVFKTGPGDAAYRFTSPGIYTITLTEDFGSCRDELTRKIQVYAKPTAQFTASGVLQSCTYPATVQFQNISLNAVAFKWFFGDGDSSLQSAPTHTYTVAGQFSPMLIALNANGCSDTLVKPGMVLMGPPVVNSYTILPSAGCIPLDVQPVLNIATPEAITNYSWDFGDNSTSNDESPTHTYTTSGRFDITVKLKTVSGCNTVFTLPNAVFTGKIPTPEFTANKKEVCGNEPVQFTATAVGGIAITSWQWSLTDTITKEQNPVFRFNKTGYKTITLTAKNFGCLTKITKENYILVQPPISAKNIIYDCDNRLNVLFKDTSQQALTWLWDFGDGSTPSALQNPPKHSFPTSGQYLVTLTTTNAGCKNVDSSLIAVTDELPVFTFDPVNGYICPKGNITIGVTDPSYIQDYSWSFGDGTQRFSGTSVQYAYNKKGTYFPALTVKYTTGCIDSVFSPAPIRVSAPTADFTSNKFIVCARDTVEFTDNSRSDGVYEIVTRLWDFGDAQPAIINAPPYQHAYIQGGTYTAKLIVTDANQCTDTAIQNMVIKELPPLAAGADSFVCLGNTIQLMASGAVAYNWQPTPGLSCINCASPTATPVQSATFYVTGTGDNGCRAQDSVYIKVVQPFTLMLTNKALDVCAGKMVQLEAGGADVYSWAPVVSLNNAFIYNPVATPAETTTYTVTASDSFHCFTEMGTVAVEVHQNPEVRISTPLIEVEQGAQYVIGTTASENISRWMWYPANGLSCADCPQPVATAANNITYTAVAYTGYGCTDTATFTIHILCNSSRIYIPTGFTPNGDGRNDRFYIQSSSNAPLRSFTIFSRTGSRVFVKQHGVTNNTADGWDGTYNGVQMPAGVYVFMAEVICNGEPVPLKGTITLLR